MKKYELIRGDSAYEMELMKPKTFDLCVTSPPYNIGIKYNRYKDDKTPAQYLDWLLIRAEQIKRVLKDDGSFFLNIAGTPTHPWLALDAAKIIGTRFVLQNTFHWIKAISISERESRGHFKPINSNRYVTNCHEYLFHFSKYGDAKLNRLAVGVEYADKSNITRWAHTGGRDKRCRGNVWFIPYETIQKKLPHPSVFPRQLAEFAIKITGAKSVIDPFVGIGTTGRAARNCHVEHFVGIDIDAQYIKQAAKAAQK